TSLVRRHKVQLKDDPDVNARVFESRLRRYVEGLGGKIVHTETGVKFVQAGDASKVLTIDGKRFELKDHLANIVPPKPGKAETKGNKPKEVEIDTIQGGNEFSDRMLRLAKELKGN
ncbi:MAG: hypothetical protein NZ534_09435, partial [Bacteroidia bacterium]|nr:hypothetical protein [Bacteroidia bacterium]